MFGTCSTMAARVEPVAETPCGLYTLVISDGASQLVVNSVTGEVATIIRSPGMIEVGIWYDIQYSAEGWAFVEEMINDERCGVSDLQWSKVVVEKLPEGRVFFQNKTEKTATGLDNDDFINGKTARTLCVNERIKLDFTCYILDVSLRMYQFACFMSHVSCHIFQFSCHMPRVVCCMSHVTCFMWFLSIHISDVSFHISDLRVRVHYNSIL